MPNIENTVIIDKDEIDIFEYFKVIKDNRFFIIFSMVFFILLGVCYTKLTTPIYQANVIFKVENDKSRISNLGQNIANLFSLSSSTVAESETIKSRKFLRKTIEDLNLRIVVTPINSSFFDGIISKLHNDHKTINIDRLTTKKKGNDHFQIKITDAKRGYYTLTNLITNTVLTGEVGKLEQNIDDSIFISSIDASTGDLFDIKFIDTYKAAVSLQNRLQIEEIGKTSINGTGIIEVSLTGTNKERIQKILANISDNYLLFNKNRYALEAEHSLDFLHSEIPRVKERLVLSENKLEKFREEHSSVDLNVESKLALDALANIETQLNELVYEESGIATKYTKKHPIYIALIKKREILLTEKLRLSKKIDKFPTTQREILRLTRVVKSESHIYDQLKQKEQELSVVRESAISTVTILDSAHALTYPIKPKKSLLIIVFAFLGFILSSVIVILKYMAIKGFKSTSEINDLGFKIYGNIPYSKNNTKLLKENIKLLSLNNDDITMEAFRLLRTNIHLSQKKKTKNIVMICSPDVGSGKSFITANLAILFAKSGKKVLVIDADMKDGTLADLFSINSNVGLSDYLKNDVKLNEVIHSSKYTNNLNVICCGSSIDNSSELLMNSKFEELTAAVSSNYDLILIDTPATLVKSDSVLISEYCNLHLVVGYFSKTSIREIIALKNIFLKNDIDITGFIVNGINKKDSINCEFSHYTK